MFICLSVYKYTPGFLGIAKSSLLPTDVLVRAHCDREQQCYRVFSCFQILLYTKLEFIVHVTLLRKKKYYGYITAMASK